jgi:hypothetical protein
MPAREPADVRRRFRHLAAAAIFAAAAIYLTYPLVWQLQTAVPGSGAGDNVTFVWAVWWLETALRGPHSYFHTDRLFAPFGTSLLLHTHAAAPSALAAMFPMSGVARAHNVVLLLGLAANGVMTYGLAVFYTRRFWPALVAGAVFATSAYVTVHLAGHFNLTHAWVIPLYALCLARLLERPATGRAVVTAVALAIAAYSDYYYALYCAMFTCLAVFLHAFQLDVGMKRRPPGFGVKLLLAGAALLSIVASSIWLSGGLSFEVFLGRISMRSVRNPLTMTYVLLVLAGLAAYKLSVRVGRSDTAGWRQWRRPVLAGLIALTILLMPVLIATFQLVAGGDYVSQRVLWRSSPAGIDLLTLLTGHPGHLLTGRWTLAVASSASIDLIEQTGWIGIAAVVILWTGRARWLDTAHGRLWAVVGLLFFVLALGPFLRIGGTDTGLPLPWAILRYVPVVSNARVPGRAMVMVMLALSMLVAFSLAGRKRSGLTLPLVSLLAFELLLAPVNLYQLDQPDTIDRLLLEDHRPGLVAELPTGLRDGFGEVGSFDHRALVHQVFHGRPIIGGFVARLSPRIRLQYSDTLILQELVDVSTPGVRTELSEGAAARAAALGVRYLVVNRDRFPESLSRSGIERAGFVFVARENRRELYQAGSH